MLRALWKMLGKHTLCGTALLALASLVQGQGVPTPQTGSGLGLPTVLPTKNNPGVVSGTTTSFEDKDRIERLERQAQQLTEMLQSRTEQQDPVTPGASLRG